MTTLNEKIEALSNTRKSKVHSRANDLIAGELSLRDLRKALKKTQQDLCKELDMKQDGISRLEHRSDMLLSTLSKYVSAMGGKLSLTAEFPNRPPVKLHGFEEIQKGDHRAS